MKTKTTQTSTTIRHKHGSHAGFTLLELLAVIVIIAILIALIFPAIQGAFKRARVVAVQAELTQLESSLGKFESRFGSLPPSYLKIPVLGGTWEPASRSAVRSIWPQFNFATNGGLGNDGVAPNPGQLVLSGSECLVFFLGGLQNGDATQPQLFGFSKDPAEPWTKAESPEGPFFEFDLTRLVNVDSATNDQLFEYVDSISDQTTPILYLTGRGKRYVKANDLSATDAYDVHAVPASDMQICYFEANGTTPHRADSFQLISPGDDGEYGPGGIFVAGQALEAVDIDGSTAIENDELRNTEKDNITNFSGGTLE